MSKWIRLLLAVILLTGCGIRPGVLTDLKYGNGPQETYDLFQPRDAHKGETLPLMLFIHGGNWTGGDKQDMDAEAEKYCQQGYITASMNYSYLSDSVSLSDQLDQIGACLEAIVKKCASMGITVNECALSGFSAGGHLALLYAFSRSPDIDIRFVFETSGPVTLDRSAWTPVENSALISLFPAGTASPATFAGSTDIPVIALYGGQDDVIGTGHGPLLDALLNSVHRVLVVEDAGHFVTDARYESLVLQYASKYFHPVKND